MNVLLELKDKLQKIINDINVGACDYTNNDAKNIMHTIDDIEDNKRLYLNDVAELYNVDYNKIVVMKECLQLPLPQLDEDGVEYWTKKTLYPFVKKFC